MNNPITLTCALLAGGRSSRFGSDKALVEIDGLPLWQHQWDTLAALHPARQILSLREPKPWVPAHLEIIPDTWPDAGPLGCLASLLATTATTHLLVLAVDLPHITTNFLQTLLTQARPGKGVVPFDGCWFQGLAAIYPREAGPVVQAVLQSDDRSIQHLVRRLQAEGLILIHQVSPDESRCLTNWNQPNIFPLPCSENG